MIGCIVIGVLWVMKGGKVKAVYFGNTSCEVWRGVLWAMGNDDRGGRGGIGWLWGLYLDLVLKYSQEIKAGKQNCTTDRKSVV